MRVIAVDGSRWRAGCLDARGRGGQFEGLFAGEVAGGGPELRAVFTDVGAAECELIVCRPGEGGVDTIVDELPAAAWDEREAADTHNLRFDGHEPLRPLLDHDAPLSAWTVPVTGHDIHQVAVGPIHAGVIESGHFRFHVVGERIVHLDARLFYKHRGLEAAARGRSLEDGLVYLQRACAACAVTNTVAYAQACETSLGLAPDDALRRARTVLLELERVYNHLHDISMICAGVGFAAGTMRYAALKELAQRLNHQLAGHRFLFGTVRLGASALTLGSGQVARAREALGEIAAEHAAAWRELQFATSLQDRLDGVGVLSEEDGRRLGAVGPAARASGIPQDARAGHPHLSYPGFTPAIASDFTGDVRSRMNQRAIELEQSLSILDDLLISPIIPGACSPGTDPGDLAVGRVESPRGRTVCVVHQRDEQLQSVHLRTGSYANWPVLAHTVPGNLLPDFPLINKSFELCYACVDR